MWSSPMVIRDEATWAIAKEDLQEAPTQVQNQILHMSNKTYNCSPIQESPHPRPPNPQKVSKRSSRASRPGVSKKCPKAPEHWFWHHFDSFFDTFLTLRAGRPGKEGLGTSLYMAVPTVKNKTTWILKKAQVEKEASECYGPRSFVGDRYDWTTGVPDNGNDWRKFCALPPSYPLRSLVLHFV